MRGTTPKKHIVRFVVVTLLVSFVLSAALMAANWRTSVPFWMGLTTAMLVMVPAWSMIIAAVGAPVDRKLRFVLAALAFKPEEFGVGVDIFGVSNWVRTLQSIPPYWESPRKALYQEIGDPTSQLEMLKEISPLFHADKITKPLIVLQGANDPRVIKPESDEIVDAIKKRNGVVEYVVFDDEGHGFTKKANEIRAYRAILDFLDQHLKGAG